LAPFHTGDVTRGDPFTNNTLPSLSGGVSRWDGGVSRTPLDHTTNYFKRVIGRPGVAIAIANGDIYVNGAIARKPLDVQEQMWVPWHPAHTPAAQQVSVWQGPGATAPPGKGWAATAAGSGAPIAFTAAPAADGNDQPLWMWIAGINDARPKTNARDGREFVTDVRFAAHVVVNNAALHVELRESPTVYYRLRLEPGGDSHVAIDTGTGTNTIDVSTHVDAALPWTSAAGVPIAFAQADDRLLLTINGALVWSHAFTGATGNVPGPMCGFSASAAREGGRVQVIGPAIDRDVHYLDPTPRLMTRQGIGAVTVPAGHYWMLGDNSRESKDGRLWFAVDVTLKDGTVIRGDYDEPFESGSPSGVHAGDAVNWNWTGAHSEARFGQLTIGNAFAIDLSTLDPSSTIGMHDAHGCEYRLTVSDIEKAEVRLAPFVSSDLLVGRAFCVVVPWENRRMIR
jgi:hypothetical protein